MTSTQAASPTTSASRALRIAAVPLMLVAGAMVAVQSQINGRLAEALGTGPRAGIAAAVISFGTGLLALAVGTACSPTQRSHARGLVAALRTRDLRAIEVIGGLLGAFLIATQGLTVGTIGVALFSLALTAGQSVSALAVDHLGLGPAGRQRLSAPRGVAAAFAVAAVLLATGSRLADEVSLQLVVFALLAFAAGAGSAVQQALNGRVSAYVGPWVTTLNNFIVGSAGLVVAFALSLLVHGRLDTLPHTWWLYLGGAIGVTFIWLAALLVRVHGVLVLGLSMIAGQIIGAQVIQAGVDHATVGVTGYAASALTVLGVLIALGLRRR
ncbi:DMT family transporter [Nocardioides jiangxiensis]|uniref:DMT family transporter n=1 Tax=Nocardioides jiangxiensis TaxID=3064524 RepID=A0ABT9AYM3_9ACTN|nr:DMT family transporter [Nocardioides sp. WY-20]MDO7867517.1 DMT family transporter [Nocardioides sp. WY-20]